MIFASFGTDDECKTKSLSQAEIEALIARNSALVYKLAFARCGNRADADDIFQQVFLRFIAKKPAFANAEHERGWFIRTTVNCANSLWSSAFRRHTQALSENIASNQSESPVESSLAAYLAKLPPNYRILLHLFYYEDLSTAQIAQTLHRKESTVRMQLTRARRQLKNILEQEGGGYYEF